MAKNYRDKALNARQKQIAKHGNDPIRPVTTRRYLSLVVLSKVIMVLIRNKGLAIRLPLGLLLCCLVWSNIEGPAVLRAYQTLSLLAYSRLNLPEAPSTE